MRLRHGFCVAFTVVAVAVVAASGRAYEGKWKMNPAKSDFGETTVTYEQLPSGEMQVTAEGQSYKVRMDEKDYPAMFGMTASWKTLSPTSWETTYKLNGKVLSTDALTVSADGKTLTVHSKGTKPNGEAIDNTVVATRVSGGPGLAGKWKTKNVQTKSPSVLEIAAEGTDGVTFKIVDMALSCSGKLDQKDYPCTGPTIAEGWTVAFASPDARTLDLMVKNNGKPLYKVTYTVAADGKTMVETGMATATNEKVRVVYDRQ